MKDVPKLLADHKKLIELEASRYAQFVPYPVVLAEAYKQAALAAERFDEAKGVKFSTFLTNYLKKLSRISTQFGGTVRLPENKQFKIQKINNAEVGLRGEHGREPTLSELSIATGFSLHSVSSLLGSRKKDVNVGNLAHTPVFVDDASDEWLHFVYHDLSATDKYIFEHRTGFKNSRTKNNEAIAKDLNLSVSTVANRAKKISAILAEGMP